MAKEFITREHVKFMSAQLKDIAAHHRNGVEHLDRNSNPYMEIMQEAAKCEEGAQWLDSLLENETEYKKVMQEVNSCLAEMKAQYDLFCLKRKTGIIKLARQEIERLSHIAHYCDKKA